MTHFDNRFVRELPADLSMEPGSRQVQHAAFSWVMPTPVSSPRLIAQSTSLALEMGITSDSLATQPWLGVLSGNTLLPGMQSYASNYGGHQFGHWAGQLGDGRAIGLGEWVHQGQRFELQLKGAGPTPYSRRADGRAVLRSSLREFVLSEAMHTLKVPTTRALSLVLTGDLVERDMFYDGRPRLEPGAIVCRVSPSFLRFGHFELPAGRGDVALLKQLADFCMARDFPELAAGDYLAWFRTICERTATLMVEWMSLGFIHGVMNTDNMSVLGLSIDYGPFGWLEPFELDWTPNTTDAEGRRYAFGQQAQVAAWNLWCLANAVRPLIADERMLEDALAHYGRVFETSMHARMRQKCGFRSPEPDDGAFFNRLFELMAQSALDHSLFFRALAQIEVDGAERLAELSYQPLEFAKLLPAWQRWLELRQARCQHEGGDAARRLAQMAAVNPAIVPRNWMLQQCIDAAEQGDLSPLQQLLRSLASPYQQLAEHSPYQRMRPAWAEQRAGCSMLSCSS
jgi:uncharacterized protein YdiU (UPF0061 family)